MECVDEKLSSEMCKMRKGKKDKESQRKKENMADCHGVY